MLAVAGDQTDGRVAIYLRDPGDAPAPEPSPSPTTLTPPPTPKQESDGARAVSVAWASLLLAAWLA